MTSSNGNIFRVTSPFFGEFTGHRWIPLTKASDAELWWVLWSELNNGWVNNREAGDLRRHRAHDDVIVMGICEITNVVAWYPQTSLCHPDVLALTKLHATNNRHAEATVKSYSVVSIILRHIQHTHPRQCSSINIPISQIPQCARQISHSTTL